MATQILTVAIISGDKAKHITVGIGEAALRLRVNTDSDMQSRQSGTDSGSTDCLGVIHTSFRTFLFRLQRPRRLEMCQISRFFA